MNFNEFRKISFFILKIFAVWNIICIIGDIDMNKYKGTIQFCSAAEMAVKWNISRRRVQIFCAQGRVEGAMKVGTVWIIPANAKKPEDPRKNKSV